MNHASLFSGIGGAEVAASMMGWQNLFHCEIQEFPRKVLQYWFPNSESYEDITKTDFHQWQGKVDVLTGGFPCQPFSVAGRRKGEDDNRYLWPQMLRAIREIKPTWIVGENVIGIQTMVESSQETKVGRTDDLFEENYIYREESRFTLEKICQELEAAGYSVQPLNIPACSVGAPHRRERVWIVARRISTTPFNPNSSNDSRKSEKIQGKSQKNGYRNGTTYGSLASQVMFSDRLPTRNAMDIPHKDMEINERGRRNPKKGKTDHSLGLEDMAVAKLLPTPTAIDKGGGRINRSQSPNAADRPTLALAARKGLLPTPCSIEATKFTKTINPNSQMGQGITALAVNGLLPAPTAMEIKHSNRVKGLKEKGAKGMYSRKNGALRPNGLTDFLDFNNQVGGGTSQLNPLFVEEMMGFPLMWTALPFLSPSGDKNP